MPLMKKLFLSFLLNEELFAVEINKVLEVLDMRAVTRVPQTPKYIKGIINFRGTVLPVIDTQIKLESEVGKATDNIIIVLNFEYNRKEIIIGATADRVKDVISVAEKDIINVSESGSKYNTEFMNGMFKYKNEFIMIWNIEKIFPVEKMALEIKNIFPD